MIAFLRRRPPSLLLRLLVLAVVALGTAGGTLASALGELHALSHADHPVTVNDAVLEADTGHDEADGSARLLLRWCIAATATGMAACCRLPP